MISTNRKSTNLQGKMWDWNRMQMHRIPFNNQSGFFYIDEQQYLKFDRTIGINKQLTKAIGLWQLTLERIQIQNLYCFVCRQHTCYDWKMERWLAGEVVDLFGSYGSKAAGVSRCSTLFLLEYVVWKTWIIPAILYMIDHFISPKVTISVEVRILRQ